MDPSVAPVLRPKDEDIAGAVCLDVPADRRPGRLGAGDLDRRLPGSAQTRGPPRDEGRDALVPGDVDLVLEGRTGAVVNPHDLAVNSRLAARGRPLEAPGRTAVGRPVRA